jgi:hypothetical protein
MNIVNYVLAFIAVTTIGMLYDKYSKKFYPDEELDKYNLVRKYLLNESDSLTGKPFIWIHTKYNINARNWSSFKSRNTLNLNQPYKNLCIKSVMKNCGNSFKICLIDDSSFDKLIPGWSIRMDNLPEPIKNNIRVLAISKILYNYGGITLPNSTIARKDLKTVYNKMLSHNDMFVGELKNKTKTNSYKRLFTSQKVMGCLKNSENMRKLIEYLEILISTDNTDESKFEGDINRKLYELVTNNKCSLLDSKILGNSTRTNNVIQVEDLMSESGIEFDESLCLIVLPGDEILSRSKYQWFIRLNENQVLEANTQISKHLLTSLGK